MHLLSRIRVLILLSASIILFSFYYFNMASNETKTITLYGNVDIRQIDLSFEVPGRVKEMHFEEGETVRKGEIVGILDSSSYENRLAEAKAACASAMYTLRNAEEMVRRRNTLQQPGAISEEEYSTAISSRDIASTKLEEAQALVKIAEKDVANTTLLSPRDGTILTRICEPGTVLLQSTPIYTLSVSSPVCIRAYISEPQLALITPGMAVQVYTDAPNGKSYKGHIGFISPVAEFTPKTVQTTSLRADLVYRIRIIVDDSDCFLKQGMPVTITIERSRS